MEYVPIKFGSRVDDRKIIHNIDLKNVSFR